MVTICEQCGDRGFSEALIFCYECQIAAVHQYCLDELPATFEEDVTWYCVDCESKVAKPSAVHSLNSLSSRKSDSENLEVAQLTQSGLRLKKKNDVSRLKNKQKRRDLSGSLAKSVMHRCEKHPFHHLEVHCSENLEKDQKFRRWRELDGSNCDEEAESVKTKTSLVATGDCKNNPEYTCKLPCSEGDKNNEKLGRQAGLDGSSSDEETESVKTKTSLVVTNDPINIPQYNYHGKQPIIEVCCSENDEGDNKFRRWKLVVRDSSDEEIESVGPKISPLAASNSLDIPKHSSTAGAESIIEADQSHNYEKAQGCRRQMRLELGSCDEEAESTKLGNSMVVTSEPLNIPNRCFYVPAQPIFEPIWNGSLSPCDENYGTIGELVAHLSTMACSRVFEEAKLLPEFLCTELLPRSDVWPDSFRKWGPSDNNIGLYLFANNERDEKVYDSLVDDMISHDLAMRAAVKNAELLIFTSNILPFQFWRFQAKFYLWGVFKGRKQAPPAEAKHSVHTITWPSQSPVSPLSNSGSYVSGSVYSLYSHSVS